MKSHFSLYIHLIRILAAVGVFLAHLSLNYFSTGWNVLGGNGHYCVVIFFVLSGYLIAFTTDVGRKGAKAYSIDRLSRLYAVVLPALIFTYLLDGVGKYFNSAFYSQFLNDNLQSLKFLLNLLFVQQATFVNTNPSSNNVFWSLSYEFWYYVIFGCAVYLKGKKRIMVLVILTLVAGVKILTLLPVWLMGVAAYYVTKNISIRNLFAILLFVISSVILIWFFSSNIQFLPTCGRLGFSPLYYSANFANDYLYGLLIAINLVSIFWIDVPNFVVPSRLNEGIKYLSVATFPLYAFHYPLLVFFGAVVSYDKSNVLHVLLIFFVVMGLVLFLNYYLEKSRKYYITFFANLLGLLNKKVLCR